MKRKILGTAVLSVFLFGCAGAPVRPALHEDPHVLPGKVEGNQFTGIRYPFRVSVPSHWKMSTEFPDFLEKLGYQRPSPADREQTELYVFNPDTKSNIQFDITPAAPHDTFSQEGIQALTHAGVESLKSELDEEYGKNGVSVEVGPTEPFSLKGVRYAAKKFVTYAIDGAKREQGWIYGFEEPYQVFVIYLILERKGASDREDIGKIVAAFELMHEK